MLLKYHKFLRLNCLSGLQRYLSSDSKYCMDLVRKNDYENFLCALLMPLRSRRAVMALLALNIELTKVGSATSEHRIGEMRMRFWKDAVNDISKNKPRKAPVAMEIFFATKRHDLNVSCLHELIDEQVHTDRLKAPQCSSLEELNQYSARTIGSINKLTSQSLGIKEDTRLENALSDMGKFQGIIKLFRSIPFNAQRGVIFVPLDVLKKFKVTNKMILSPASNPNVKEMCSQLYSEAHSIFLKVNAERNSLKRKQKRPFLFLTPSVLYMKRLKDVHFDIFHKHLRYRDHLLPLKLFLFRSTGTVGTRPLLNKLL